MMGERTPKANFMLKEIYEQPETIEACLEQYCPPIDLPHDLPYCDAIHILACGTSLNASLIGQFLFEQLAGIPTQVRSASEALLAPLIEKSNTLTIAVTQSGETLDTVLAIQKAQFNKIAITNGIDSTITKLVDQTFYTNVGEEKSVAATKTFTAQLVIFHSLALTLAARKNQRFDDWHHLIQMPSLIQRVLQQEAQIIQTARSLLKTRSLILLGSGINYPIALEGALKLKEATYTHAEGYAAGEFRHGPIALLDEQIPTIALFGSGNAQVEKTIDRIKINGGQIISFEIPPVPERLSPILNIIPLQLLAYHLAILRGIEVDRPRNITKSLTN